MNPSTPAARTAALPNLTLLLPPSRPGALCAQADPDAWFPERTGPSNYRTAQEICRRCPHQAECLQWALDTGERHGVWGGLTPAGRRQLTATAGEVAA